MKNLISIFFFLVIKINVLAQDLNSKVITVENITCNYDKWSYPKVEITISPALELENTYFDTFIGGFGLTLCPDLKNISDRKNIPVSFVISDKDTFYDFDQNQICNYYQSRLLYLLIPVPTNTSKNILDFMTVIEKKLILYNVSSINCDYDERTDGLETGRLIFQNQRR